ncbi:PEGA domain-containing protein [bacterium]|nr:PEGA domain-containing protein [bacterium]
MRRITFLILLFAMFMLFADFSTQRIAVMDIVPDESARGTFSEKQLHAATQYLYSKLAGKFNLINQTQLKEIYAEMIEEGRVASRKQCIDDNCRIELGKSASANYNLNARISQFAGSCTLTVEMINLKTTMVEQGNAASADFQCNINGLQKAIVRVASILTGGDVPSSYAPPSHYSTPVVKSRPRFGTISITSEPSGVDVSIDGQLAGVTPFTKKVKEGNHTAKIASRCFREEEDNFSIDEDEEEDLSFELEPRLAQLNINIIDGYGQVVEGEVIVDGESVGDFPGLLRLPLCTQKVTLISDENRSFSVAVRLNEHRTVYLKKRLKKSYSNASRREKSVENKEDVSGTQQQMEEEKKKGRPALRTFQGFDIGYGTVGLNAVAFGYHFEFSPFSFFGWDLHSNMLYAPDTEYFDMQFSTGPKLFFALGRVVPFLSVGGSFIYALDSLSNEYGGGFYLKGGFDIASQGKFAVGLSAEYAMNFGTIYTHRFSVLLRLNY